MRLPLALGFAVLTLFATNLPAQEVDNPNFAKGKSRWLGDGKVVFLLPDGTVSEKEAPGSMPALQVELQKIGWREVKQSLNPKPKDDSVSYSIKVKAGENFQRSDEARFYDVDFKEGGGYGWSAEAWPKCDFLIRVRAGGWWFYRPFSLSPNGTWKTFSVKFGDLKDRPREISLLFPPGEGTVYLQAP